MLSEFKKFIMRGNVLDLAIGVIIGAAFGKIVASLVNDVLMPVIGLALGKVDFSNLFILLHDGKTATSYDTLAKAKADGATVMAYGVFVNTIIEFLIVAFVIFLVIKSVNKLQKPAPPPPVTTKPCPECTTEIPLAAKRCPACTSVIVPA